MTDLMQTRPDTLRPGEDALTGRGLTRHFPVRDGLGRTVGTVKAVQDVDLQLRSGECLALVGESGCGKSTLASLITLLDRPTAGSMRLEEQDVSSLRGRQLREFRRNVQIVLQDPYAALNPRLTIGQSLREPLEIHGGLVRRGEREAKVVELLELVGLDASHRHRYPHEFSGGQRQRVCIARALAVSPRILVCDEPVSALDVSVQAQILDLLQHLQRELGLAYLFISHDLAVVRGIADRVAVMYLGRIVEEGPTAEVFTHPRHPYTQALLSSVPVTDPRERSTRERIRLSGDVPSPTDPPSGCAFRSRCWLATDECATTVPSLEHVSADHRAACVRLDAARTSA
ncbi:ABC transporter ATP-binding protein [Ornithinimicrobium cavernae]|uniref:ABC transporter ATP-binding protein n=1 Tax=Ornithinimicrobium cavernae TaxID=2666047 RepID=UPI001EFF835E|nr:dipeptide ABC transporter ATP-binding protein [Ornithinimicrobium cavernae]